MAGIYFKYYPISKGSEGNQWNLKEIQILSQKQSFTTGLFWVGKTKILVITVYIAVIGSMLIKILKLENYFEICKQYS